MIDFTDISPTAPVATNSRRAIGFAPVAAIIIALLVSVIGLARGWPPPAGDDLSPPLTVKDVQLAIDEANIARIKLRATSPTGGAVRAWWFLAEPGNTEPWKSFEFQSRVVETVIEPGGTVSFDWAEPLLIRDGRYQPTLWFHQWQNGKWVHLYGGALGLEPVTVDGPGDNVRRQFGGGPQIVPVTNESQAEHLQFRLTIQSATGGILHWQLYPSAEDQPVYRGIPLPFAPGEQEVLIDDRLDLLPGRYDLWITTTSNDPEAETSQSLQFFGAVLIETNPGYTRARAYHESFRWTGRSLPQPLISGRNEIVPMKLQYPDQQYRCVTEWTLIDISGYTAATGQFQGCDHPRILLPIDVLQGNYSLSLTATLSDASGAAFVADIVTTPVEVTAH